MSELCLNLNLTTQALNFEGLTSLKLPAGEGHLALNKQAEVSIRLPEHMRLIEQRYLVDKAIQSLGTSIDWEQEFLNTADLGPDAQRAFALDRFMRSRGQLESSFQQDEYFLRAARGEALFREWVDEDPSTRTSLRIAEDAEAFAELHPGVKNTVLKEAELEELGLNLLLAVGGSSELSPARLVILEYRPDHCPKEERPQMLLGKGITFDTGGINVKPYESYVSMMKNDMAGAALAYALFVTLVESGYKKPLLCVLPTCENAVGSRSMRPGALVKSYAGPTVRIDHTDAEGRLVLADGLAYAAQKYDPSSIWSFATLTTSALNSYGPYTTPVHFADEALQKRMQDAAHQVGEDLHFFEERIWHRLANEDEETDLRNTARLNKHASRAAGSRNAAHFLKRFADHELVHFDIFASTWNWAGDYPSAGYGATGAPFRTLLNTLWPKN